ncbi:MAG: hypothetical protein U5Q03_05190 [Bacteroidota bacterium]|nr:hypothetical protein [Bacteroidota bacterium]
MKQITLLILNSLSLVAALYVNYLGANARLGSYDVSDISSLYENLFTPAAYAFGIWGLIYFLLLTFVVYQWYAWIRTRDDYELKRTGLLFTLSNILNAFWIYAWVNDRPGISLLLMFALLAVLIFLVFRLRLEIWDAPVRIIAFVWWPVCIYTAWVILASIANFSAWLVSLGWNGGFLSEIAWSIIMLLIATAIYVLMIYYRNMREAALVGIWGMIAIAVRQWTLNPVVAYVAIAASFLLFVYVIAHAYKNRETSPIRKIQRQEI